MNSLERYLAEVMDRIQAPPREVERIKSDLRNHLQDLADELGEDLSRETLVARMGTPEEVAMEFMSNINLDYAGFFIRTAAFLVDMAACLAAAGMLALPAVFLSRLSASELAGPLLILVIPALAMILAAAGLMILYFPILEGRYGTTLGKYLLNLRVVKESGAPIGYKEAFLRRIPYYFEFLVIDVLFIPFTGKKQRAFDLIARTVVIKHV